MEQYIHTLIAADSKYLPKPGQVAEYFGELVSFFGFRIIRDKEHWQPGLRVTKPGARVRTGRNTATGETFSVPVQDQILIESVAEIPQLITGLSEYRVCASGEWLVDNSPLSLLNADKTPFNEGPICDISCNIRPDPVSTSDWDIEAGPNLRDVPPFGGRWIGGQTTGIFPNPWTGEVIEVEYGGCACFWIEFEFGKFLFPRLENGLDVLNPSLVERAAECFQTKFVQGCRFW